MELMTFRVIPTKGIHFSAAEKGKKRGKTDAQLTNFLLTHLETRLGWMLWVLRPFCAGLTVKSDLKAATESQWRSPPE